MMPKSLLLKVFLPLYFKEKLLLNGVFSGICITSHLLFCFVEEEFFPETVMLTTMGTASWNFRGQRRKMFFQPLIWTKEPSE